MYVPKKKKKNYAKSNAIAISNPEIKRKTNELNSSHRIFGKNIILKSLTIEIELAKEKKNIRKQTVKQIILPYSYIHRNSEENLNLSI